MHHVIIKYFGFPENGTVYNSLPSKPIHKDIFKIIKCLLKINARNEVGLPRRTPFKKINISNLQYVPLDNILAK